MGCLTKTNELHQSVTKVTVLPEFIELDVEIIRQKMDQEDSTLAATVTLADTISNVIIPAVYNVKPSTPREIENLVKRSPTKPRRLTQ